LAKALFSPSRPIATRTDPVFDLWLLTASQGWSKQTPSGFLQRIKPNTIMKLTTNKLAINRRSIASLNNGQLDFVQGGRDTIFYPTTTVKHTYDCAYLTVIVPTVDKTL
jgi:hypothetical protein